MIHEIPTWVYRVIIGAMLGIILSFVINIHDDFKEAIKAGDDKNRDQDSRIQGLEYRTSTLETKVEQKTH